MKTRFGKSPMIVGCIATEALLRRSARKPPADCDLAEVRLDLTGVCGGEWMELCAAVQEQGRPVLLTIRDRREGGEWRGREAERLALYLAGLKSVSVVDVEIGAGASVEMIIQAAHRRGVKVVGSFHDFHGTPELSRLRAMEHRGRNLGVDVVKIATLVKSSSDLARLYALPSHAKGPISAMGMGPLGAVSRVALPCAGSCLVYGALEKATAPGQLTCHDLAAELTRWGVRNT